MNNNMFLVMKRDEFGVGVDNAKVFESYHILRRDASTGELVHSDLRVNDLDELITLRDAITSAIEELRDED